MLYDYVQCPHRTAMDLFHDPTDRDQVSPFVQLLWERGADHEREVIKNLRVPFLDLSMYALAEKERRTLEAMDQGVPLIYGGRITADDLLGDPDLLRKESGGYVAGDIKSGAGEEGGGEHEDGKPKLHYAVQLALYTDILEKMGRSADRRAFVWDIHGDEVPYDFVATYGTRSPRCLWNEYEASLAAVRSIASRNVATLPAYGGVCKHCVWYSTCLATLKNSKDLTLIATLGRAKRDIMLAQIPSLDELAAIDPAEYTRDGKTVFAGIGPATLEKYQARAKLLTTKDAKAYLTAPVSLPAQNRELFFDVEVDPMRDVCYLHGFVERLDGDASKERFVAFFADEPTPQGEERAFSEAWTFLRGAQPCAVYYYSKYERTIYRKLQAKYPSVCSAEDVEALFDPALAIDLYSDVVMKATEWPTHDFSIKTLATYLGFSWRDTHPSGAASIEWFHRWIENRDPQVRQRILDYNEDDCRATRVLLDGVRAMAGS